MLCNLTESILSLFLCLGSAPPPFIINSSALFHDLLRFCFNSLPQLFSSHLQLTEGSVVSSSTHWNRLGPLVKSFCGNFLHFLSNVVDSSMCRYLLISLEPFVPFFEPFVKLSQKLLRELLSIWSTKSRNLRIDSFLRIRQLALELPTKTGMLESALKGIYLTYVRHSSFTTPLTIPVLEFMSNCIVELYSIDITSSYQHIFVYIRQLAIHMRNALINKNKDTHKSVYHWQFINQLRCWCKVLSVLSVDHEQLRPLIYPLVQICQSTITLLPSARYFPLRFQVIRFLNQLAQTTQTFIPLTSHLLTVLQSADLLKKPNTNTRKVVDIKVLLKVSKQVIGTKVYQESTVNECINLLLQHLSIYSYSVSFPEYILPTQRILKKLMKVLQVSRIKKQLQQLMAKLDMNVQWIQQKRNNSQFTPKDMLVKQISGIRTFYVSDDTKDQSPLQRYVVLSAENGFGASDEQATPIDESDADWEGKTINDAEEDEDDEDEKPKKSSAKEKLQSTIKKGKQQLPDDEDDEFGDEDDFSDFDEENMGDEVTELVMSESDED